MLWDKWVDSLAEVLERLTRGQGGGNTENKKYRKFLPSLKLKEEKEGITLVDLRTQCCQESLETWNR